MACFERSYNVLQETAAYADMSLVHATENRNKVTAKEK